LLRFKLLIAFFTSCLVTGTCTDVGNQTHNTEDQILEGWKSHFEQLAERSICENYDKDYLHLAEAEYQTKILLVFRVAVL
jgi:hypothetical protein